MRDYRCPDCGMRHNRARPQMAKPQQTYRCGCLMDLAVATAAAIVLAFVVAFLWAIL
jgi:hypothetical protein